MTPQYLWLLIFGIVLFIITTDENVAKAFFYVIELAKTNIRKQWWWFMNNPRNPIAKYLLYRKSLKTAKELRAKIDKYYEENPTK